MSVEYDGWKESVMMGVGRGKRTLWGEESTYTYN